jgi:hypothetical protein
VRVRRKKSHLALRITTIRAMGVSLNEFPNRKPVGGFRRRDRSVFTHQMTSLFDPDTHAL